MSSNLYLLSNPKDPNFTKVVFEGEVIWEGGTITTEELCDVLDCFRCSKDIIYKKMSQYELDNWQDNY